jgi:hypothetical protein
MMPFLLACVLLCAPAVASAQSTMKAVNLSDGLTDQNEVTAPVYDTSRVTQALGLLGSADAVALLSRRYEEEEDCRWATMKAMAYIGGDAAMQVVKNQGLKDEYVHARRLAEKIVQRR